MSYRIKGMTFSSQEYKVELEVAYTFHDGTKAHRTYDMIGTGNSSRDSIKFRIGEQESVVPVTVFTDQFCVEDLVDITLYLNGPLTAEFVREQAIYDGVSTPLLDGAL